MSRQRGAEKKEDVKATIEPPPIRAELARIAVLAPWTTFVPNEPSFSDALNQHLTALVQAHIWTKLEHIYHRVKKQQQESDAHALLSKQAMKTVFETRMAVEAQRSIDLQHVEHKVQCQVQSSVVVQPEDTRGSLSDKGMFLNMQQMKKQVLRTCWSAKDSPTTSAATLNTAPEPTQGHEHLDCSITTTSTNMRTAEESHPVGTPTTPATSKPSTPSTEHEYPPLFVEFPKLPPITADTTPTAASSPPDADDQVLRFRRRPVCASAVQDAGSPLPNREPAQERVRYILSTHLGALPPTQRILDEYPIPREILDALEAHRHYHIDESSLMTSFDAMPIPDSDYECYVRRSVPIERQPMSFVLSSLEIAPERPVPPPSDIFQQYLLASASNEDLMLTEVRQLYDHTHDAYRDFRSSLHRHLDLEYLVRLSFRSSLNSGMAFLEEEEGLSTQPSLEIPEHLCRKSTSVISKWRLAKKGAFGHAGSRRGAMALQVKAELTKAKRNELVDQLCHFSPHEVQLMDLWYMYDGDMSDAMAFDPIPMSPELSARFDAVWMSLEMPAKERLDLATKYASLENASRLADAVLLWETCATLIKEREELLRLTRQALCVPKKTAVLLAEETALLRDLAHCTANVKEALLLAYVEVGDFVTYGGNFYLAKMEHEATELRQAIVSSMDAVHQTDTFDGMTDLDGAIGLSMADKRSPRFSNGSRDLGGEAREGWKK